MKLLFYMSKCLSSYILYKTLCKLLKHFIGVTT